MERRVGIASSRNPCRSKRRRQGHNKQEGGHASQDHWIARGHAVEQAGCELSHFGDPTEADGFTGQHERQRTINDLAD
jgi:hypothetical protein